MLGEALALCSAFTWASAVILFKRSEAVSPQGLNLYKNTVSFALLIPTLLVLGQSIDWQRPTEEWLRLVLSGVLGIAVADTFFFAALRRLGPGTLAVVDCSYAPFIVTLAVVFLGETTGAGFLLGAALVVGGILTVTTERPPRHLVAASPGRPPGWWAGVVFAVLGVASMAVAVIIAKRAIERGALVEVTLVRLVAGILAQLFWLLVTGNPRELLVFKPTAVWRTLLPASILGSYVSMLLWLGGFKWADASVAAVLNQLTTVFIIVLARVFLGESLSVRRALGSGLAILGAIVVLWG